MGKKVTAEDMKSLSLFQAQASSLTNDERFFCKVDEDGYGVWYKQHSMPFPHAGEETLPAYLNHANEVAEGLINQIDNLKDLIMQINRTNIHGDVVLTENDSNRIVQFYLEVRNQLKFKPM